MAIINVGVFSRKWNGWWSNSILHLLRIMSD